MTTCASLNTEFCERIQVYERHDGSLAFIEDYAQDANARVLLRKLRDVAGRFAEAFASPEAFAAFFPRLRPGTRLAEARATEAVRQLGLGLELGLKLELGRERERD